MPIPTCPTDCTSALPVVDFDQCNPKIHLSEIRRIFIAKPIAATLATPEEATEWTTRISEDDVASDDAIRPITVIADKPASASTPREISNGRRITVAKTHTINFTIDDISPENYEFMRMLECGGTYKIWYETEGGYIYGGADGIIASVNADDILNRGREEIETIAGTITWTSKFSPDRILSPIFDSDFATEVIPAG